MINFQSLFSHAESTLLSLVEAIDVDFLHFHVLAIPVHPKCVIVRPSQLL